VYPDPELPKAVTTLIDKMLDEDCGYPSGTAEKAASELLERAISIGRADQFKAAMKFWKNSHACPERVLWQWFNGVFKNAGSNKPKSRKGKGKSKP